jgi:hypothetical protein
MNSKRMALTLTVGAALAIAKPTTGHAQSTTTIITPVPPPAVTAEKKTTPNVPLLATGLTTMAIGYAPALGVAIASDHKGDDQLFIPVVGPWLDIGNRSCSGPTAFTPAGPYEVASLEACGSSAIETTALVADGIVQGVGALQFIGSFFVPQRRVVYAAQPQHAPRFSVAPSSFAGRGAGAVAAGHF